MKDFKKANDETTYQNLLTLIGGKFDELEVMCCFQDTDYEVIVHFNYAIGKQCAYENYEESTLFIINTNEEDEITSIRFS